ncbi:MAG: hypothetical protein KGJ44_07410 [Betaproteobacteria bacterium]|nr:hypothetical protein [Betaproteobacteria bacterium]
MQRWGVMLAALSAAWLAACSPALNWREVRLGAGAQGNDVLALFPCRPERATRRLLLDGVPADFTLLVCSADGMHFSLGGADIGDPQRVAASLTWLQAQMAGHLVAQPQQLAAFTPRGACSADGAVRFALRGQRPDAAPGAAPLEQRAAVFARGSRVYQAVVMAERGAFQAHAADQFLAAIECP